MQATFLSMFVLAATLHPAQATDTSKYFRITVVDDRTGRGVPLVELRTVNGISFVTDSNGIVAFQEPGLMNKDVFFHVASHGYEFPMDAFGIRGKALRVTAGAAAELKIKRINLAERLYRITGGGIYRDSVLVGAAVPLREPVLNGLVLGSDSVLNAVYRGKLHWFWGDTNRPGYPLGNFQVPGAISKLPSDGGLDPDVGIDLSYFLDAKRFAKETMRMPGKGPTWMTTLIVLPDEKGQERLYASYIKIEPPLKIYARGLAVFQDDEQTFKHLVSVDMQAPAFAGGHAFRHRDEGVEHVYFAHPFPLMRVRATASDFLRPEMYESYTCLKEDRQLDRDAKGQLIYAWRKNAPPVDPASEGKLLAAGKIKAHETRWRLRDRDTGKVVLPHAGSVYWNAHCRCWVMIAVQQYGSSFLGEVWYAEADTPVGPWLYAVKVMTHERYSFYNPKQHPMFDKDKGRVIYFEGTYTHTFSGNQHATPRYDYNQIMYKLDLADPRAALPLPMYDVRKGAASFVFGSINADLKPPGFFALDRAVANSVPVFADKDGLKVGGPKDSGALFHALPADIPDAPASTTPLYEYRSTDGTRRVYSVEEALPGYQKQERAICRVWKRSYRD